MMLAAASLNLDTLWICMFKPEAVREEFALPANVEPVNILLKMCIRDRNYIRIM